MSDGVFLVGIQRELESISLYLREQNSLLKKVFDKMEKETNGTNFDEIESLKRRMDEYERFMAGYNCCGYHE